MKILKIVICAALLVAGLCGCEKIDVNKLEGTWTEQYDPTVFAMDGSVTFTFDGNNGYQLHVYDALSGESHDYSGHYAIDLIDKGTITINPAMSDDSNVTYKLVKLTSKEMEWQKEGTTYSDFLIRTIQRPVLHEVLPIRIILFLRRNEVLHSPVVMPK